MREILDVESLKNEIKNRREGPSFEFKGDWNTQDPKSKFEAAKDVAGLANGHGGFIVIGARNPDGELDGFDPRKSEKISSLFQEQTLALCSPPPLFMVGPPLELSQADKAAMIVTVWPSAAAPIGVRKNKGETDAWVFPRRIGSLTDYLNPNNFVMIDSTLGRRAASLLYAIPHEERNRVYLRELAAREGQPATFIEAVLTSNVALFQLKDQTKVAIPLDEIRTVWKEDWGQNQEHWFVALRGSLSGGKYSLAAETN